MNQLWKLLKRWGLPLMTRIGLAMPLLLVLGTVLMLGAIWWLGPQWMWREQHPLASMAHRSLASLVLVLVPLLCWLVVLRRRYGRLQAERKQAVAAELDSVLPLVQAQEKALDQGLSRFLDGAGGRRALYRLPWYLVIGDQHAGKTSFIDRTEQSFSLTRIDKAQARGRQAQALAFPIGWWLSNDAVIIDPPGAFIRQESLAGSPVDESARQQVPPATSARLWQHLLDWLLRSRSQRALNGILLVVDLPALLHGTPEQRIALAHVLRTRLYEVSSQLGSRLPLYVVLTKFDLLDGFDQLYAGLSVSMREKMLGFTFKLDAIGTFDAWLEEYGDHYEQLISQLFEQVVDRLDALDSAPQRARLFSLHAQLIGLRPILLEFLKEALASDRYTTPALVRGVYWSSVIQQGDMFNAFVREAAQPYKTKLPLLEGKAQTKALPYFIQHAFGRVIYKEAGLAGDNIKVARSKRQLLWVGAGVGMLAFCVAIAGWQRFFDINGDKAANVLAKSREYSHHEVDQRLDPTGRNLLEPLDQIRDAVSVFGDYRTAWPGVSDFGLYQGRAIGPRVDEAYLSLLSKRFLPALASGVIDAMDAAPPGSEQQMAALRVYRMLEDRQNRRTEWVEEWMTRQWQQKFPGQGQLQRDLMRHLKYALAYADTDLPQYSQRVAVAQAALRKVPLPERVYAGLKQQAGEQLHIGLDLRHQVGPAFDVVYQPSMSARKGDDVLLAPMLTAKGFKEYFEPRSQSFADLAMIDQWALGERSQLDYSDADRETLSERLRNLYSADYIDSWRRALNAFSVADFRDLDHGVAILQQLTGPAAPLHRLLDTVRDNTSLSSLGVVEVADEAKTVPPTSSKPDHQQAWTIQRAFAGLSAMLQVTAEKPSYYDETLAAIAAVHDYAKAVQDSPDRGKAALQAVHQRFSMTGHDPIGTLQRVSTGLPEPINHQVRKVADQTAQVLNVEALRELERRWDAEVYSFFQQRLAGRYPFVARAPDASLDDFEAFFGPKGRLQQFNEQYLKVFLKDNLEALQTGQQGQSLIRSDVIEQLELADRIRETFFDQRGNLSVQFSIEPLGLSANQRTSLLDLDGQLISYTHGTSQITGIIWPNTLGQHVRSNLTLLRQNGNSSSLEYRGPWSMFRLLSRGSLNGRTATSVDLSFRTGDGVMRYRISAEKAFNPITQQPFKGFRLPRGLLQQPSRETLVGQTVAPVM
ncbi:MULTISPECIES: type VI secretion system membrane subunit TssM [unclassified Pseudomonas]|uniref:type VI secretion system membrane subunit TssM n=1 Tax=unclassified Pseudomonas TaxID=196821 RepID=UPI000C88655F|nr:MULTISPECIES: type VI secretion system membrane subunit TssM [unclassified Pseudomonas]PMZ99059.1 type VI secretion system membrane subunit TssM [Pseudomonas sp. FW305-42]PNA19619.1 type VI secretion system membrane subunit TssM [Pseudomonas sp. MPR-R1B]PNB26248.1 type VI secretion system membrane subunit TssM [Pseudomonas sp. DP16D-E2]PNB43435.1 type VI secretion system membrane subunit TssM [Pseudomonas sp. FW305-17]PNB61816.1 type VI secretion system membrane subunit TssM [Pseudomonas sp